VPRDDLADVRTAVRRALAARTSDGHLIDDLTQETLLRIASTDALSDDERRAYAVVTARNLLTSHHRRRSVQARHLHELVEHGHEPDPEQRTIASEEVAALKLAMTRVDPDERELLVRHEVGGTNLATLAGEAGTSNGAIAMRLARARANLRLEFLLVFRRLSLPTDQCRPVLLALAVGDARRQAQLHAADHLQACPTCASLAGPMIERNRRAAAWLPVPIGLTSGRIRRALRTWWARAVALAMMFATIGGLALMVHSATGSDATTKPAISLAAAGSGGSRALPPLPAGSTSLAGTTTNGPTTSDAPAPAEVPGGGVVTTQPAATQLAPAATQPMGDGAAPCPPPAPLDVFNLSSASGCPFTATVVAVVSATGSQVSAHAGAMSVTIHLLDGPSAIAVPGSRVSVSGTVTSVTDPLHVAVSGSIADAPGVGRVLPTTAVTVVSGLPLPLP